MRPIGMYRTQMQIILTALMALALAACGRDETGSATSAQAAKDASKSSARKAETPADAPKSADPLKEGY